MQQKATVLVRVHVMDSRVTKPTAITTWSNLRYNTTPLSQNIYYA